jgi:DDE superfamily endonuclease
MVAEQVEAERLLFVDEMGTNTSLSPAYAWAKKGQRAYCSVPRNRGMNTTVLSSMSAEGMGASLTVEGATTSLWSSKFMWSKSWRPRCAPVRWW